VIITFLTGGFFVFSFLFYFILFYPLLLFFVAAVLYDMLYLISMFQVKEHFLPYLLHVCASSISLVISLPS